MDIELGFNTTSGRGAIGHIALTDSEDAPISSANKSEETEVTVTCTLYTAAPAGGRTVYIYLSGGHSNVEDYGVGKHYTLAGADIGETATLVSYNLTRVTLSYAESQDSKTFTMTVFDNQVLELDRTVTIYGSLNFGSQTLTIVDDNVELEINALAPPEGVDPLIADGTTNNDSLLEAMVTHGITTSDANTVIYIPDGEYVFYDTDIAPSATKGLSIIGQSKNTIIKRQPDTLSCDDAILSLSGSTIVVTKTAHGLSDTDKIFFGNIRTQGNYSDWEWLEKCTFEVAHKTDNTFQLHYTGVALPSGEAYWTTATDEDVVALGDESGTVSNVKIFLAGVSNASQVFNTIWAAAEDGSSKPIAFSNFSVDGNYYNDGTDTLDRVAPNGRYELEQNKIFIYGYASAATGGDGTKYLLEIIDNIDINNTQCLGIHPLAGCDTDIYNIAFDYGGGAGFHFSARTSDDAIDTVIKINRITGRNTYGDTGGSYGGSPIFRCENVDGGCTVTGDNIDMGNGYISINLYDAKDSDVTLTGLQGYLIACRTDDAGSLDYTRNISLTGYLTDTFIQQDSTIGSDLRSGRDGTTTIKKCRWAGPACLYVLGTSNFILEECENVCNADTLYSTTTHYAAPYIISVTGAGTYKLVNCSPVVEGSGFTASDKAVLLLIPATNNAFTYEIDNSEGGTDFTHLIKKDSTAQGGIFSIKNMDIAEATMMAHKFVDTYRGSIYFDTINILPTCTELFYLNWAITGGVCLTQLTFVDTAIGAADTPHGSCEIVLDRDIEAGQIAAITGAITIYPGAAPSTTHGFKGCQAVYDGHTYEIQDKGTPVRDSHIYKIATTQTTDGEWVDIT